MATDASSDDDALLTPSEVAAMFRVNPKTVTRWAAPARSRRSAPSAATAGSGRARSGSSSSRSRKAPSSKFGSLCRNTRAQARVVLLCVLG